MKEYLDAQWQLQVEAFGLDPLRFTADELEEYVRWNVLALEDELHEALQELSWKPWAQGHRFDVDAFRREMVDALHFMLNLLLVTGDETEGDNAIGMIAHRVRNEYFEKRAVNAQRQAAGYDGLNKCRICGRAFDDELTLHVHGENLYCPCGERVPDEIVKELQ